MSEASSLQFQKCFVVKALFCRLESVGEQQRHNSLAYMMYIILFNTELACIIRVRFLNMAVFGSFVNGERLFAVFWLIIFEIKAKQIRVSVIFCLTNYVSEVLTDFMKD